MQDNVIDKIEYESLYNTFTKYVGEIKMNLFYKFEYENNNIFFGNNKLNFQPKT